MKRCTACESGTDLSINGITYCAKHMKAKLAKPWKKPRRKAMRPEYECFACGKIYREPGMCGAGHLPMERVDRRKTKRAKTVDIFTLLESMGVSGIVPDEEAMEKAVKQTMYALRPKPMPKRKRKKNELTTRDIDKKTGLLKADKRQAKLDAKRAAGRALWRAKQADLKASAQRHALELIGLPLRIRRPAMTNG